ncbi:dihydroxyacetone kinase subunit DhaL [Timonella sp. A28]|uniref:dihydroxyacetone kinase subunit DhaL n=1 Tax=Timonella sp. A28 TaxID=3442640 RepID=UPI003EBD7365
MTADIQWAIAWMKDVAAQVSERKNELTTLDRVIGDGDHGENMNRGFEAVVTKLDDPAFAPNVIGDVLKVVATTLMSTVGGASGPLYGTAFLRASKVADAPVLTEAAAVGMLEAALEGVQARGKAQPGEKTMVDAWFAAVQAAQQSHSEGGSVDAIVRAAGQAAVQGAEQTTPLKATKGRASYLGDRSIGHKDPGATSTALILESAARKLA